MRIHCWFPDVRIVDMVLGDTGVGSLICQLVASLLQKSVTPPLLALVAQVARTL